RDSLEDDGDYIMDWASVKGRQSAAESLSKHVWNKPVEAKPNPNQRPTKLDAALQQVASEWNKKIHNSTDSWATAGVNVEHGVVRLKVTLSNASPAVLAQLQKLGLKI